MSVCKIGGVSFFWDLSNRGKHDSLELRNGISVSHRLHANRRKITPRVIGEGIAFCYDELVEDARHFKVESAHYVSIYPVTFFRQ